MDKQRQQSPVEVIIELRKNLEEFLRTSSPQTYKEEARAALRKALLLVAACSRPAPETWLDLDNSPIIEHLRERGVIHTWSKRQLARRRRALLARASSPSPSLSADPVGITQSSISEQGDRI
jgi:hypothetical protein